MSTLDRGFAGPITGCFAMRMSAVDLFCGAGGLTRGLLLEGIKVNAGVDSDPACRYPYEHNNGCKFVEKDIRQLTGAEVAGFFPDGDVKILVGCAPCQPFSTYTHGHESPSDSKWSLPRDFARIVREVRPEIVSMENVPRLARHHVYAEFLECLTALSYHVTTHVVRCADYGVPQTRKRLVLFASTCGQVRLVPPTHEAEAHVTVRDAIGDLDAIPAGGSSSPDRLHRAKNLTERNLERIKAATPGGTWRDWDKSLVARCHRKSSCTTYVSVYGRMEWDKPAPTITTQCCGFGNGRFGHPEQDRAISLREAALLQTFPADYEFVPPDGVPFFHRTGRLIGNAVPVAVARAIARSIRGHVEGCHA